DYLNSLVSTLRFLDNIGEAHPSRKRASISDARCESQVLGQCLEGKKSAAVRPPVPVHESMQYRIFRISMMGHLRHP
ncbi:hypothetical protein, partial [Paraburkholderia nemoris]|uniref:hypothetical protein n=1 Tax=Paraburkholderia nemoris TaxID=2793076 RepID=UPI0038BA5BAF